VGSIDEKNQKSKISCYCPFKGEFFEARKKKQFLLVLEILLGGNVVCVCMYIGGGGLNLMKTDSPRCFGGISY
jgi:hypothetical protein